jgi:DoxX-like family
MRKRYGYWIFTALLVLWLIPSGILDLIGAPAFVGILQHLGYAAYVGVILGVAKLLAVGAIVYPRTRFLREWAYAGITFDTLGAFLSHLVSHDSIATALAPILVLAFAAGSYILRPEKLRLLATP